MCRFGKTLRSGDEGRGEEGGVGAATTEEARRWDAEPSRQVKGDRDPHYRSLCQSQAYRPLCVGVYVYTATHVPIVNQVLIIYCFHSLK